jgi:PHP family Zn ribbon phosphoesterase
MSPIRIARCASENGLDLIALTDHNSARNCPAFADACRRVGGLHCVYGMELTSMEEAHILALFDRIDDAMMMSDFVYDHLPDILNNPERFGDQVVVDVDENIIETVDRFLGNALSLSIDDIVTEVHARGGIAIPSHVDRDLYSISSQIGFIPDTPFDGIEFSKGFLRNGGDTGKLNKNKKFTVITSSDSHYPDSIGSAYTEFETDEPTVAGILRSLHSCNAIPVIRS